MMMVFLQKGSIPSRQYYQILRILRLLPLTVIAREHLTHLLLNRHFEFDKLNKIFIQCKVRRPIVCILH
ncbi:UNVERIFIED_CONTAM: hypothetical protein GTU68_032497 [Idotea baltica]|nr:hypothetical protein [Idotea baltica]